MITRVLCVWPYRSSFAGGTFQYVTAAWTWGRFGHVELWFLEDGVWKRGTATTTKGICYDPTGPDGQPLHLNEQGTGPDPKVYYSVDLTSHLTADQMQQMANFFKEEAAKSEGYDWDGITHWWFCFAKPDDKKYYCSESVAWALSLVWPIFATHRYQWAPSGFWWGIDRQLEKLGLTAPAAATAPGC